MISATVSVDARGFGYVRGSLQNKIIRKAFNKAAAPVKAKAVELAPVGRGYLSKSIRIKVKYYKAAGVWCAVVGPSCQFKRKKRGTDQFVRPCRYAHLQEFHGKPFLRPALTATQSQFQSVLTRETADGIEQGLRQIYG